MLANSPSSVSSSSPSDAISSLPTGYKVRHLSASFFVGKGADVSARFIEHYIFALARSLGCSYALALPCHDVGRRIYLVAERHRSAVHRNVSRGYLCLGCAAGKHSAVGKIFLDPYLFHISLVFSYIFSPKNSS